MPHLAPPSLSAPQRLVALDTLRGAMLMMMACNHIPTEVGWLTNQPLGYVSNAEGFVSISGLLVGLVYGKRAARDGLLAATRAALRRAAVIYRAHMLSFIGVYVWVWLYYALCAVPPPRSPALFFDRPVGSLLAGTSLVLQPGLLDILPMYCGFLLLTPLVLWQLQQGRARRVLCASLLWWGLTNVFDLQRPFVRGLVNTGAFNFGAWQLLFVSALMCGYAWGRGGPASLRVPRPLLVAMAIAGLSLWAARHGLLYAGPEPAWLRVWTNKINLAPLRAFNIVLLAYGLARLVRAFPAVFRFEPLALVGRHSLPAFVVHIVLANVMLDLPQHFDSGPRARWLATVSLLGAMWLTAMWAQRRSSRRAAAVAGALDPAQ